ncbi:MAG TPA: hypothetical protein VNO50_04805 [Pyrinomonadaceae bacterium]|nr:hypothetical protein [Pyrinomonadaceae bacterium]
MNWRHPRIDSAHRVRDLEKMMLRLKLRAERLEAISNRFWIARRIIAMSAAVLTLFACKYSGTNTGWVLAGLFLAVFVTVTVYHRRVLDSIRANSLMLDIKQIQIARIHLDWNNFSRPLRAQSVSSPNGAHPFETDLDITGNRSLHQLLDSAVTKGGSERLKAWLLNATTDVEAIARRQSLVRELVGHSLFRDKLQLISAIVSQEAVSKEATPAKSQGRGQRALSAQWDSDKLVDWLRLGVRNRSLRPTLALLGVLAALNVTLVVLALIGVLPHVWPATLIIYFAIMNFKQSRIATAWGDLQELEKTLRRYGAVFQYLESRGYKNTPGLAEICSPFLDAAKRPSTELKRLERLAAALGVRTNAILWLLFNAVVPWDFYFAHRLNLLREELAELLPRWLDAWYELEALNSLANFAYLNPAYVFPEVIAGSAVFGATAMGHPLLKPESRICNDFEFNEQIRIAILTGSNMAGKSTFLRTVGVNLCLSYAGAPVNAERFQTSMFRLFSCIKVSDSVQDGLSYFYAEVKRLKALLSAAQQPDTSPLMFLIDEIFRGTNSRERLIGARAFIRELSRFPTFGLVATHDLELVKLADEIAGAANFHFREEVRDGKMVFDYQLRPGPCPTTNALHIMRLEGLPVE